jgi:hypothetical protein
MPYAAHEQTLVRGRKVAEDCPHTRPEANGEVTLTNLLDQLVGTGQQRRTNGKAECLGSLEVDNSLDFESCWIGNSEGLVPFAMRST